MVTSWWGGVYTYLCVQASGFGTLRPAGAASAVWLLSELGSQVDTSETPAEGIIPTTVVTIIKLSMS